MMVDALAGHVGLPIEPRPAVMRATGQHHGGHSDGAAPTSAAAGQTGGI
jgi:hypothetical protein